MHREYTCFVHICKEFFPHIGKITHNNSGGDQGERMKAVVTEARVTHDGHLSACCFDHDGRFHRGDLKAIAFMEARTSEAFQDLRQAHLSGAVRGTVCGACVCYG